MSWSIGSVDDETREAAQKAARRSGMSLDEWLRRVVAERASEDGAGTARRRASPPASDDDIGAVAASVARLARRIRSMDASERAAISGLRGRLDEIERHLGRAHRSDSRSEMRTASLRDVSAMVDRLARDLDNADETARSIIEGIGERGHAAASRRTAVGGIGEAIRGLDARLAAMADRVEAPPKAAGLDDLRARLDSLLARAPEPARAPPGSRAVDLDETLKTLEARIEAAKARLTARPETSAVKPSSFDDEQMRQMETRLAEISARLGRPGDTVPSGAGPAGVPDIGDEIAEIAARQRSETAGIDLAAMRADSRAVVDAIAALRTEVNDLVGRVVAIGLGAAEDQESHFALIRRIEALAAENPMDRRTLADIRGELAGLRADLDGAAREATVLDRFDDLLRKVPDRGRLDALGGEIADLRRRLENDDSPKAVARLEMRVNELARSIDTTFNARQAAAEASAVGTAAALADIRGAIEDIAAGRGPAVDAGGIAELAAGIAGIRRAIEEKEPVAGGGSEAAIGRIEERLDQIAAQIDGVIDRAAPADFVSGIHDRLEALADRMDRVGVAASQPAALDEIRSEIAAIRGEIGVREPPRLDYLEGQIRDLADRLKTAMRPDADLGQLADLEARVSGLAAELERATPRTAALERVEEDLTHLQSILSDSRRESVEAARAAAREAVRDLAGRDGDAELVRALRQDLDQVRHAAGDSGQRTEETLRDLQRTLGTIVDRLGRIEGETGRAAADIAPPTPQRVDTPAAPPLSRQAEDAIRRARPLDVGAARPDLAALRELAASSADPERRSSDRRADFIAAARRAAHAAVAEAGTVEDEMSEPKQEGAFARIGQAIRNRRKPLLLAAAAIVLAIGALHLFGSRTGDSANLAAVAKPAPAVVVAAPAATPRRSPVAASATSLPSAEQSALVAPPADARTAMALAAEPVDGRFGDAFAASDPAGIGDDADGAAAADGTGNPPPTTALASPDAAGDPAMPPIGSDKLRAAASAGDPAAAFEIGTRFAEGRGVAPDLVVAAKWYQRAAGDGLAVAQYRLGSLYERGQGVDRNPAKAVEWYQRAADQGNVGAMHNLAVLMSEGVDGPPDHAKALEWFLAAGSYGVKDSQYNLGVIYARGLGPAQDLLESYKWFAVAAAQGDADAAGRRDEVAGMLDADQLAKARALVQAWRVKPPLPEANGVKAPDGGWDGVTDAIGEADRMALVKKIQTLLVEKGYDPGPTDGIAGPKTREAARAFQRAIGAADTGEIDRRLATALADGSA